MYKYIGTKIIQAEPMNRLTYNEYRGWQLPANENPDDEGYLVEYLDGGKPNDPRHDGYISWSPKEQFEAAYNAMDSFSMTFGHALVAAEAGNRIARAGWNGKGMFVVQMPALYLPPFNTQGTSRKVNDRTAKWIGEDAPLDCQPYFAMYTATKQWQPGWIASQADMLARDWGVVDG